MDLQLSNLTFVVTGGASGIGLEIARTLSLEGAIPVLVDRDKKRMEQAVEDISRAGGKADSVYAELTNAEECSSAVNEIVKRWGRVGGLVNNAGVNDGVGLETGNPAGFMDSISKNLLHYYSMAHFLLPELKKSRGAIVNIGSKVAVTGQGGTSGYAAANGGRNALTREWAVELLPYGIRVNSVIVAECLTPLYENWIRGFGEPEMKLEAIKKHVPLGQRMTEASEIAASVAFLLSPRSSHTTGQMIYVDGGYTHLDRAIT